MQDSSDFEIVQFHDSPGCLWSQRCCLCDSIRPVRDEDIDIAFFGTVPAGSPDKFLPVIVEHRERVESVIEGDLLKSGAISIDEIQIEIRNALSFIVHV